MHDDYADAYSFSTTDPAARGFNNHTFPGFMRGFHIPDDENLLHGDYSITAGEAACMAIYISDNVVFDSATYHSVIIPTSVSATEISGPIKKGPFYAGSLVGKFVHVQLANGTMIEDANSGALS